MTKPPLDIKADRPGGHLVVTWSEGDVRSYRFRRLREVCQCAACVDEITGRRILDVESIPDDITLEAAELVGSYALRIRWSDGHNTGLYTWEHLHGLEAA